MRYLITLAFRNIRRNRRRSLLAVISVTVSILFIVFIQGMTGGMMDSMVRNYTRNESGHIRISTRGFADKARFFPVTSPIRDPAGLMATIRRDPEISREIAVLTPRISFGVLLSKGGKSKNAVALAGDIQTEKELRMLYKSIQPGGRYLERERDLILGSRIAGDLGYRVGDTVRVMTQGSDYALHLKKFVVCGIFQTGMKMLDEGLFQISLGDAQDLLRLGAGAQQIFIFLKDYRRADAVAALLRQRLDGGRLVVTSWSQDGSIYQFVRASGSIYNFIFLVVALLGAFIIGNIMMMAVLERRREIGILKALGFSRNEILFLFLSEGAMLGFLGSLLGASLGFFMNLYFHCRGLDFSSLLKDFNFPLDNVIYFPLDFPGLVKVLLLGTAVAGIMSLAPARQAGRMKAAEAMKSV